VSGLLSIVIPSSEDRWLAQTINDVFAKAAGAVEVIAVINGYTPTQPLLDRDGLRYLYLPRASMRGALNAARPFVAGDWVMKSDEHCLYAPGFDEVLKQDCDQDWLLIPRRYSLDPENWCIENNPKGPRDYHYLSSCVWSIRERDDYSLNGLEWPDRTRARMVGYDIDETMSWQGSFYFMSRRHYEFLGPLREDLFGSFASEPQEIGLKTQLSGGKVCVSKKTYGAHLHKGKKYGRGYRPNKTEIVAGHEASAHHWMTHPKMREFIEHWWPCPTWPADTLERWDYYFPKGASLEELKRRALAKETA
jgi:hypothetical protein